MHFYGEFFYASKWFTFSSFFFYRNMEFDKVILFSPTYSKLYQNFFLKWSLRVKNLNLLHGVRIAKNTPTISYQLYANDIVIFRDIFV